MFTLHAIKPFFFFFLFCFFLFIFVVVVVVVCLFVCFFLFFFCFVLFFSTLSDLHVCGQVRSMSYASDNCRDNCFACSNTAV